MLAHTMKKTTSAYSSFLIDTNIFLRTLIPDHEAMHKDCVALMCAIREGRIRAHTSSLVIAEIVWTLLSFYKIPKTEVLEAVQSIAQLRHLSIEARERVDTALNLYTNHNVKFVDALLASAEGVQNGAVCVVSYDREFDRIPGVVRKEPRELVKR